MNLQATWPLASTIRRLFTATTTLALATICAQPAQAADATQLLMVQSGDHMYRIRYGADLRVDYTAASALLADDARNMKFTATKPFPLPLSGRQVDKVVAAQWIPKDSLILPIRLHDTKHGGYGYCWATYLDGRWASGESALRTPESERPYEPSDLTGYPKDGDTIGMTWLRDSKNKDGTGPGERLDYLNQCPASTASGPDQDVGQFVRVFGFKDEVVDVRKRRTINRGNAK